MLHSAVSSAAVQFESLVSEEEKDCEVSAVAVNAFRNDCLLLDFSYAVLFSTRSG